ncbi:MAG: peptide ABC transporter substrate-binding protein [Planctomycetes bacterium]|nr:peptide ABC transporter substrate-binding protein [Planctomycetota bacterium]
MKYTNSQLARNCFKILLAFLLASIPSVYSSSKISKNTIPTNWQVKYQPKNNSWQKVKQNFYYYAVDPETLDPALITGSNEMRMAEALFEGLLTYDPKTLEARPGVASSWTVQNEGKLYTFTIRKNALWSDGTKLTSHDFYHSWQRVLEAKTAASYAMQLYPIDGAEKYHKGQIKDFKKVGISCPDKHTLVVRLKQACPYFTDLAAFVTLYPTPIHVIQKYGDRWVRPEHIVSNGPFILKDWQHRQKLIMQKSSHYWAKENVKLNHVTALLQSDLETAYKLFLKGQLHWMDDIPLDKLEELLYRPEYYVMPFLGVYFYRFNVNKVPFNDSRVRRAFSLAIDRLSITQQVTKAGQRPHSHFCPPMNDFTAITGPAHNPQKARMLLEQAGYGKGGKVFPEVELLYNTSEGHKKIAEAIVQQWEDELGVQVSLRNSEWKVFLNDMKQMNYDICRSSWIGDYADPNTYYDLFITDGGNNRTGWSHEVYDDLLKKSTYTSNPSLRISYFQQMEKILSHEENPIIPIYQYVNQGLLQQNVNGWYVNNRDIHPFKYIWLDRELAK